MNEVHALSPDRLAEMRRVSSDMHYQIAMGFDESDAEGTIKALIKKYPDIVINTLYQSFIENDTALKKLDDLLQGWRER